MANINDVGYATDVVVGVKPEIKNVNFNLSAYTYDIFYFEIIVEGTLPITFIIDKPSNYNGNLSINGRTINGICYSYGNFEITFKALNNYGVDSKKLNLTIDELIRITNTNLKVYSLVETLVGAKGFAYTIESSGLPPKHYEIFGEPPTISLYDNVIRGVFTTEGTYSITMLVTGSTSYDIKKLVVISGTPPIINSSSTISGEINQPFEYKVTSSGSESIYYVIGSLPKGLKFKIDTIYGTPKESCKRFLTLKAVNPYGEALKDLILTIYI